LQLDHDSTTPLGRCYDYGRSAAATAAAAAAVTLRDGHLQQCAARCLHARLNDKPCRVGEAWTRWSFNRRQVVSTSAPRRRWRHTDAKRLIYTPL